MPNLRAVKIAEMRAGIKFATRTIKLWQSGKMTKLCYSVAARITAFQKFFQKIVAFLREAV
jgi:hypothetical protein